MCYISMICCMQLGGDLLGSVSVLAETLYKLPLSYRLV